VLLLGRIIYALSSSVIFRKYRFILMLNGSLPLKLPPSGLTVLVNARYLFGSSPVENGYPVEYANDLGLDIPQLRSMICTNKCIPYQ